jgi:hypothetical protein
MPLIEFKKTMFREGIVTSARVGNSNQWIQLIGDSIETDFRIHIIDYH